MSTESVGYRLKKALEIKYGHINNSIVATKYGLTPQAIGQQKVKKSINETISLLCEKELINLNWIQTGKGQIFIEELNYENINESLEKELLEDIPKLTPKQQEYYYHRVKADLIENEKLISKN